MNMSFRANPLAARDATGRVRQPAQLVVPIHEIAAKVFASPSVRGLRHVGLAGALRKVGTSYIARALADSCTLAGHRVAVIEVVHDMPGCDDLPRLLSSPAQGWTERPLKLEIGAADVLTLVAPGSDTFAQISGQLEDRFDVVIWDLPPPSTSSPTALLAAELDGTIVVVQAESTTRRQLSYTVGRMRDNGASLLGVVINRVVRRRPRWLERA